MSKKINGKYQEYLYDSSKILVVKNAELADNNPEILDFFLEAAFSGQAKYSQRAVRVIVFLLEKLPEKYSHLCPLILDELEKQSDESVIFSLLKVFTFCPLPEEEEELGALLNLAFNYIETNVNKIAIKVYSIDILYRISQKYPELKNEVLQTIKKYKYNSSMAYISRANKAIKKLRAELGYNSEE